MSEEYKVKWEDVKKVYNNRNLVGSAVVSQLRELFEVEFFKETIQINQEALDYRIKNIERKREEK